MNHRSSGEARPAVGKNNLQRAMARKAAKEKAMASMIPLECGHYTSLETQQLYRVFSPPKGHAMCENSKCETWRKIVRS